MGEAKRSRQNIVSRTHFVSSLRPNFVDICCQTVTEEAFSVYDLKMSVTVIITNINNVQSLKELLASNVRIDVNKIFRPIIPLRKKMLGIPKQKQLQRQYIECSTECACVFHVRNDQCFCVVETNDM